MISYVAVVFFSAVTPARADQFDAQIQDLNNQIAGSQAQVNQLAQQADTLANKVSMLNDQIGAIAAQLQLTQTKLDQVNAHIAQTEAQLATQKSILAGSLQTLYIQGDQSSLEILASSNNISDYFDKQQYLEQLNNKVQTAMQTILNLESSLKSQQADLTNLANNQQAQQQALGAARAQVAQLLAETQNQESNYRVLVNANQQKLATVYSERAAYDVANHITIHSGGTGGYPFANAAPDGGIDPWGFLFRECVSYVAWKRRAEGLTPYPLWWGNAGDWVSAAPNSPQPTVGSIAVFPPGVDGADGFGHVAYVEAVTGNTVTVSEYNWVPYSYDVRSGVSIAGLRFIH